MKLKYILLLLFSFALQIHSQSSTARFLYFQPSAEILALGGAGVALPNNSFSAYYNPSSFAFANTFSISSSFEKPFSPFGNQAHSLISFSHPFKGIGSITLSMHNFWIEPQLRTGEGSPEPLGTTYKLPTLAYPTHYQIKLSYATKVYKKFALGLSIGLLDINHSALPVAGEYGTGSSTTFLFDVGLLYKNLLTNLTYNNLSQEDNLSINKYGHQGISLGLSVINFGTNIFFIDKSQEDPPPTIVQFGIVYTPLITMNISDNIFIDFENRVFDSSGFDFIHLGNELMLFNMFPFRLGYFINLQNSDQSFFTMGLGVKLKYFSFNIARYKKFITPTWSFDLTINAEF